MFKLKENQTTVKREFVGALTTFLTASYILVVNPKILSECGMNFGALVTSTGILIIIMCLLVGLFANMPLLIAPGMGLNAFFAYTLVIGQNIPWQIGLGVVFISGAIFFLLSLFKIRKWIVEAIPESMKASISAGLGLFLCLIGFESIGFVASDPATIVKMGSYTPSLLLGLLGVLMTLYLIQKRVKGAMLIGIFIITVVSIIFHQSQLPTSIVSIPPSIKPVIFHLDILSALKMTFVGAIFSFVFVIFFDTTSTTVACAMEGNMYEKNGEIRGVGKILIIDSIGTMLAGIFGNSPTVTFVESTTGVSEGARTGLSALFLALFFVIALFFSPLISIVPAFATAPALIIVGLLMFKHIGRIDLGNFEEGVPAFFTIFLMPITYSITTGISFGFILFVAMKLFSKKADKIHPIMWLLALLSVINLIFSFLY